MGKDHVGSKKTEEDVVNKEKQWLFAKLAKVLGAKNPIKADGEQDWNSILKLAKQHAVLSLLDPLLDEPEECGKIPENVKICIREEARKTVRQNYHLLYLEHRIIRTLQEAGVSVVLLKGASTAKKDRHLRLSGSGTSEKRRCRSFFAESGTVSESGRKDGKPWLCEKSGTFG